MPEIRRLAPDEIDLFRSRLSRGFGQDLSSDPGGRERFDAIFEPDRTFAAFDGTDVVGTVAAFSLGITVPGARTVPMAGTTIVTVQPTHRRQGVMRSLMTSHLEEARERSDPLAGLWASESSIYNRFGFGPATHRYFADTKTGRVSFRQPAGPGRVRLVESPEADSIVRNLYESARASTPGMLTRSDAWWEHRVLADVESWRDGKTALRYAIYEEDGSPRGYAMYRQKAKWDDYAGDGQVSVSEMIALDPAAHRSLWSFLTHIDLFPNVDYWNLPIDDPLPEMLAASRGVERKLGDGLWLRVLDVCRALEGRTYEYDDGVVIEVIDPMFDDAGGVFELTVEGGEGSCRRTDDQPQVTLSSDVLGALYLGGGNAMRLRTSGRITGEHDAVTSLHRLFRTDSPPWCNEVF